MCSRVRRMFAWKDRYFQLHIFMYYICWTCSAILLTVSMLLHPAEIVGRQGSQIWSEAYQIMLINVKTEIREKVFRHCHSVLYTIVCCIPTSIDSGHYTASINCCKKTFYCNDYKITEFGITDKNSSTAYIILYKWIDTWFLDSDRRVGVWSLPWRWHILSIPLTTGRGTSAETCGLDDVFPPDDLGSRPETLC